MARGALSSERCSITSCECPTSRTSALRSTLWSRAMASPCLAAPELGGDLVDGNPGRPRQPVRDEELAPPESRLRSIRTQRLGGEFKLPREMPKHHADAVRKRRCAIDRTRAVLERWRIRGPNRSHTQ